MQPGGVLTVWRGARLPWLLICTQSILVRRGATTHRAALCGAGGGRGMLIGRGSRAGEAALGGRVGQKARRVMGEADLVWAGPGRRRKVSAYG